MLLEAEARKGDVRFFSSGCRSSAEPSSLQSSTIRGAGRFDYDRAGPALGFSPSAILGFGTDDPTGKDLSWIGDYSDELSVSVATRMFEEAVVLVEKGMSRAVPIAR